MTLHDPHLGSSLAKVLSFIGFLLTLYAIVSLFQLKILQFFIAGIISIVFMYLARLAALHRYRQEVNKYLSRRY